MATHLQPSGRGVGAWSSLYGGFRVRSRAHRPHSHTEGFWPEESGYQDALMPADTPLLPNPWAALGRRVEKTESR